MAGYGVVSRYTFLKRRGEKLGCGLAGRMRNRCAGRPGRSISQLRFRELSRVGVYLLGTLGHSLITDYGVERIKVRKAMEKMLRKAAFKIVTTVNKEKDHIPPIMTSDTNPFPYEIVLNPKLDHWSERLGLY